MSFKVVDWTYGSLYIAWTSLRSPVTDAQRMFLGWKIITKRDLPLFSFFNLHQSFNRRKAMTETKKAILSPDVLFQYLYKEKQVRKMKEEMTAIFADRCPYYFHRLKAKFKRCRMENFRWRLWTLLEKPDYCRLSLVCVSLSLWQVWTNVWKF